MTAPIKRRRRFAPRFALAMGAAAPLLPHAVLAVDPPRHATAVAGEINDAWRASVERGLAWLANEQGADGSFGSLSHYGPHVAITGLSGMAFLCDGNTPGRGRYGPVVDRAIEDENSFAGGFDKSHATILTRGRGSDGATLGAL